MRVLLELVDLVRADVRHEPEVCAGQPLLGGHRSGHEVAVGPPGGQHGDLDAFDQVVQLVDLLLLCHVPAPARVMLTEGARRMPPAPAIRSVVIIRASMCRSRPRAWRPLGPRYTQRGPRKRGGPGRTVRHRHDESAAGVMTTSGG